MMRCIIEEKNIPNHCKLHDNNDPDNHDKPSVRAEERRNFATGQLVAGQALVTHLVVIAMIAVIWYFSV